jgi:DNA mismatch endonuclease, patch repair protein
MKRAPRKKRVERQPESAPRARGAEPVAAKADPVSAKAPARARYNLREGHLLLVDDATSARMGLVRQKGTRPELVVRRALTALGLRFRLSNRDLPGSPDIANRSQRWAVFVHGCFWHRHGCKATTTPTRNREFWQAKFQRNLERDRRAAEALRAEGYAVVVIWECTTKGTAPALRAELAAALGQPLTPARETGASAAQRRSPRPG